MTAYPGPAVAARSPRHIRAQRHSQARLAGLALLCTGGWVASVTVGGSLDAALGVQQIALAVHIMAMVVSLGAILLIDWVGLLWLLGRRQIHEPGRVESAAVLLIWGGLGMLLLSGAFISPDLSDTPTRVKLACVLVLMLNGVAIAPVMKRLHEMPASTKFSQLSLGLRARMLMALSISQACWWSAVVIGLLNSAIRRGP